MNEKIKEIAIFAGYIVAGKWVQKDTPNYLTDLNALHRVALDVMQQLSLLRESTNAGRLHAIIMCVMFNRPNSKGEYVSLVDAVYDAIVYLKKHSQCQPK